MKPWDRVQLSREKKTFIERRLASRAVGWHLSVIFIITWFTAWLVSALLLHIGKVYSLPWRYAMAFLFAYLVFFFSVRVWANSMHDEESSGNSSPSPIDAIDALDMGTAGEGCLFFVLIGVGSAIIAGIIYMTGGAALLLEVAFEVVYAGTLVRSVGRLEKVGDWAKRLFWNTLPYALIGFTVAVGIAYWLQQQAPNAATFSEAVKIIRNK